MFKALVFCSYFLLILPAGTFAARVRPLFRDFCFYGMLFMSCRSATAINLFPMPELTGTIRGFSFTLCFFFALIVLFSMIGHRDFKFSFFPSGTFCYLIYFVFSCISLVNAELQLQAWFEVWKMVVMYITMITTYNYVKNVRNFWPFIYTVAATLSCMLLYALYQKYVQGFWHISSTFPHRNSMSLYSIMWGTFLMGIFLNEKQNLWQSLLLLWGIGCVSLLILFSLSRGGIAMYGGGQILTIAASLLLNGIDRRKIQIVIFLVLLLTVPVLFYIPRIIDRYENAPKASGQTRVDLAKASVRIANDYFWGIGLNNYSDKSSPRYDYTWELYEGIRPDIRAAMQYGAIVETIYLLVAAECGWITLGALLLWFGWYYVLCIRNMLAYRHLPCFGICVGLFGGLTSNYVHSTLEWSLKQESNFAQIMIVFAVIVALSDYRKRRMSKAGAGNPGGPPLK